MSQVTFEVPNLDCESADDLRQLGVVFRLLAEYSERKARAVDSRKRGDIQDALDDEKLAEMTYKRLPEWARW